MKPGTIRGPKVSQEKESAEWLLGALEKSNNEREKLLRGKLERYQTNKKLYGKPRTNYLGAILVGTLTAFVILAWMLAAHLEYVELTTKQVFCWDFAAGEKWIETECNKALAYD